MSRKVLYIFQIILIIFIGIFDAQASEKQKTYESSLTAGLNCKTLGYRWGYTARATMLGKKTKPSWDFSIPTRCRGNIQTEEGIKSGVYAASN